MGWNTGTLKTYPKPGHPFSGDALFNFGNIAGAVGMLVVAQNAGTLFTGDVVLQVNVREVAPV